MYIKHHIFNSSNELADYLEEKSYTGSRRHHCSSESKHKLRFGDEVIVKNMKGQIKTYGQHDRKVFEFYGKLPSPARALAGNPRCFLTQKRVIEENKYITLVFDVSVPWYYSSQQMIENGKKLIAIMKYMEQNGFRIRLIACASSANNSYGAMECNALLLKLKEFDQPFSVTRIAFPIANPDFLRDVSFEWEDKDPVCEYHSNYGYALGHNISTKEASMAFSNFLGKGTLFITHFMVERENFQEKLMENSETVLKYGYETL